MVLLFDGKEVYIEDAKLEKYRHATGMDISESYVPYCASNEGVSCEGMSSEELSGMVRRMMDAEIEVACG